MKTAKKLFASLLAVVMALALAIPAFAAPGDGSTTANGSITITNATKDATYQIYKVFDATYVEDSNPLQVVYTYTTADKDSDSLYSALSGENSPFALTETATRGTYSVTLNSGYTTTDNSNEHEATGSEIAAWLKTNVNSLTQTGNEKTATSAEVKFENLAYGYYYITSSVNEGANVTITSAVPTATVIDKNTRPAPPEGGYKVIVNESGDKITGDSTVNYGDTVYYMLQVQAANYVGDKKLTEYVAHDVLGAGLKDLTVIKVVVVDEDNADTSSNTTTLIENTGYTVDKSPSDSCSAEITIPWVDTDSENLLYNANSTIQVYVQATVDTNATIGPVSENETSNLTNKGWFTWKDEGGTEHTPDNEQSKTTVTSTTYAIGIYKTDGAGNALSGASFTIQDSEGNQIYVKETTTGSGTYEFVAAVGETDRVPTDTGVTNTVVSPGSGRIIVKGVAAGTYTLTETAAPTGYNLLTEKVTVESTEFASSTTTTTIYKDEDGNITNTETDSKEEVTFDVKVAAVNVVNNVGTTLPDTGGIGTTIFYVVGGVLIVGAVVLLVTRKRMREE